MRQEIITTCARQTKNLGRKIAKQILQSGLSDKAVIFALNGELGAGKTTFVQGFSQTLSIRERILSPTYVIMKRFEIPEYSLKKELKMSKQFKNFYHIDCYRIKDAKEMIDLGFVDIINNPENIIIIEWAEKIKKTLAKHNIFFLELKFLKKNQRKISISDTFRI